MNDLTRILDRAEEGDSKAAEELVPLVYEELRRMAAHRIARESATQTLDPTALVHEAWLRLAGSGAARFSNRAHFFGAAAEAMRRILIERARRRRVLAKGGFSQKEEWTDSILSPSVSTDELFAVHEALDRLAAEDPSSARLVTLRYFVGMNMSQAAEAMGLPLRSTERLWTFARAWLRHALER